ncbi:hypothetical protein BDW22DRAFT_1350847 [Trametopsis cervina]|nr:hypothetical protein BDW22DRAFT_1350847 [Trametopsis cervina]
MSTSTDVESSTSTTAPSLHPDFADMTGDVVLRASDDVLFYTHSLVLSLSSRWFREMFTLPQRPLTEYELGRPSKTGVPETISVSEPAKVLAGVLGVVSGQPLPSLHDIDYVDDLLRAAEKYEMQSVISLVRVAVMMPGFLKTRPVRVYGIASSRGWAEEAQIACEGAVTVDLLSNEKGVAQEDLEKVDSVHLIQLLVLQRRRREKFRGELSMGIFAARRLYCSNCGSSVQDESLSTAKEAWLGLELIPPSTAGLSDPQLLYDILEAECGNCPTKLYDAADVLSHIEKALKG